MTLVTGKSVVMPGITTGNIATKSMFDSEAAKEIMERHHDTTKTFREAEYSTKLDRVSKQTNRVCNDIHYEEKNLVLYQEKDKKALYGPEKVFCHRGRDVWI